MAESSPYRSIFVRLRRSSMLRLLFAAVGLIWAVNAAACMIHDVSPDCHYSVNLGASERADSDTESPGAVEHVPCCPHPLGTHPPMVEDHDLALDPPTAVFVTPTVAPSYLSYTQSPPTPPPITA